ncbi:MAG: hypothetical protein HY343_02765 [Lentisphaerae bacterium]|nr:hypothetical protein [Lentisphaerota bacterium]
MQEGLENGSHREIQTRTEKTGETQKRAERKDNGQQQNTAKAKSAQIGMPLRLAMELFELAANAARKLKQFVSNPFQTILIHG